MTFQIYVTLGLIAAIWVYGFSNEPSPKVKTSGKVKKSRKVKTSGKVKASGRVKIVRLEI